VLQAGGLRGRFDGGAGGLIRTVLEVGPVVDHALEAFGGGHGHRLGRELRGDVDVGCDGTNRQLAHDRIIDSAPASRRPTPGPYPPYPLAWPWRRPSPCPCRRGRWHPARPRWR